MKVAAGLFLLMTMAVPQVWGEDGSSGCGPGWYILKDNSLVSSALRAVTNNLLFPVSTIGMTVGTSNCTQHKLVLKEKQSLHFATMNYFELKGEVAQGQGDYLTAFAETIGCPSVAQSQFNSALKNHYQSVFPKGDAKPQEMLVEVYKLILTNKNLSRACSSNVG